MGLEVADWMVSRGARKLVFVSRSGVTKGYQAYRVKVWRDQGVNIIIDDSDVSVQAGAENALTKSARIGPVGGIFNFALVLRDAVFQNQTAEHFEIVSKGKILATKELDKASRNFAPQLDYFVCFSSIVSSRGNAGQTSYGFANSFMERLCEERCRLGLPGLAIQWGAIGDVGVLHNLMGGKDVVVAGCSPQKIASCLEMFDLFLNQSHPVMSSFVPVVRNTAYKQGEIETLPDLVAQVLAIKDTGKINKGATLIELGMDSLMAAEVKILLENKRGISLPVTTVGQLTFSKLMEMETNQLSSSEDLALEFKQFTLLPMQLDPIVKMATKEIIPTTLFMIHPLDGNMFLLERLMKELDVIVYGLQCEKEAPLDSIEALARFYLQQIKTIQEKGPYQIGGYSFGAAVAFEIAIQLECQGELVENLVLLDGCPNLLKSIGSFIYRGTEKSDELWLLYFIFLHMPINLSKVEAELSALSNWDKRLSKTAEMLHEVYPKYSLGELRNLAASYSHRVNAGYIYEPSAKVKCQTTLIRASATGLDKKLGNDYQLNQVCEMPVNVLVVDGGHNCFHERPLELGIPKMINDIFVVNTWFS